MTPRIIDVDALNQHLDRALHLARLIDQAAERVQGDPLLAGEIEALADAIGSSVNRAIEIGELSPPAPAEPDHRRPRAVGTGVRRSARHAGWRGAAETGRAIQGAKAGCAR